MIKVKSAVLATLCSSIIACGGGSSDSESDNSSDTTVLTGIFLDSAVEGASYSTATQSGTTNAQGQFNYIAGEQVTFSIGDTQLPVVNAAPQVSPVEMAASSSDPSATTTNIARLLQSLDTDGNPDNGITISPTAAANAASINFNVSEDQFSNDTDVINLVANSGSITTTLVSADAANAHLNDTLGISNTVADNVALANFAGFYDSTMNSDFQHYLLINTDGSAIEYEDREENIEPCFDTEIWTFVSLGGSLFRLEREGRDALEFSLSSPNGGLQFSSENTDNVLFPQVTALTPADLSICS